MTCSSINIKLVTSISLIDIIIIILSICIYGIIIIEWPD